MITDLQWQVFGLVRQEGLSIKKASDIVGITPKAVADLLDDMKKQEPELFPPEKRHRGVRTYHPGLDILTKRLREYGRIDKEDVWCLKCDKLIEECVCDDV